MSALIHLTKKENQNKTTAETLTTKLFPSVGRWHSLPGQCPGSLWLQTVPSLLSQAWEIVYFCCSSFHQITVQGTFGWVKEKPSTPQYWLPLYREGLHLYLRTSEIFFSRAQKENKSLKTTAVMANTFFFNDGKLVKQSADFNHRDCRSHKFKIGLQSLTQNPLYQMHFGIQNICIY